MSTKLICDKCGKEIKEHFRVLNLYQMQGISKLIFKNWNGIDLKEEEYDICIDCTENLLKWFHSN